MRRPQRATGVDRCSRLAIALVGMARPDQLALVTVVYAIGVLAGATQGGSVTHAPRGLVVLLLVAFAVHYANEYADYETDAMTTPTAYSGGSGVLQALDLDRSVAARATIGATALASCGIATVTWLGSPPMAVAGLACLLVIGLAYSVGPGLAWHGLGEVTNAALGGLVLPLYGIAVSGVVPDVLDALAFLPFATVVFVNLLATQWPDRRADATVGKRTLAVRLDVDALRTLYLAGALAAAATLAILVATGVLPALIAVLALPTATMLALGWHRYGTVESPAVTVHAMVAFAFAYVAVAACTWP